MKPALTIGEAYVIVRRALNDYVAMYGGDLSDEGRIQVAELREAIALVLKTVRDAV